MDASVFLKTYGLRDTQPRRLVVHTLSRIGRPTSAQALHAHIRKAGHAVNLVTVYRVLALLKAKNLVHEHPCDGSFSLCSRPDSGGHHGFLHCTACDKIEEFQDPRLCKIENVIAHDHRFTPHHHVSEILGTCSACR
jgi:Fe2+ or Zn2+ uptake regulation protein